MPFLKQLCPNCKKVAEYEKEFQIGTSKIIKFKCGHFIQQEHLATTKEPEMIESLDGKKLFPYQCRGARFGIESGARCLISDEMGLGKTAQALTIVALMPEKDKRFLGIVKAALTEQWQREAMRWLGEDCYVQVIKDQKDQFLPGMDGYIISYDMVRRFAEANMPKRKKSKDDLWGRPAEVSFDKLDAVKEDSYLIQQIKKCKINTIIMDEVQQIKNTESKRTIYVRELCKHVEHIIALSGTPIKNNALEYFPILNILRPTMFPKFSRFQMNDCDTYFDGYRMKAGGLRYPAEFMEKTKDFIIRREMKDVKSELPTPQDPITRNFSFHQMGQVVGDMYEASLKEMLDFLDMPGGIATAFEKEGSILKYLTKMRHYTGLAKIDPCIDHVMEFLGSCERKMMIFVHHHDVAEILQVKLASIMKELELAEPIRFEAGMDAMKFVNDFKVGPRVAIVSTLAGGEGMDGVQEFCSDLIMLERQWNPANEEQAEKRISQRIGQKNHVVGTYFVAVGTVDEFFSEIVERKREIVSKTLSGQAVKWDQSSLIKELTETLQSQGLKRWSLR